MNIKIKKLTDTAQIPTRGSEYAAGYDLYADIKESVIIPPQTVVKIPTGIATEIPHGFFGAIFPRSGIATKRLLNLINDIPVIDEDYRGEWILPIFNAGNEDQIIEPGERIAQFILLPYQILNIIEVNELSNTTRGENGFGSSGTK